MRILKSPQELVSLLRPGQRIFVHGGAATPLAVMRALCEEKPPELEFVHLHTEGPALWSAPELRYKVTNLFLGSNIRCQFDAERVDYLPSSLSDIPSLFRNRRRPLDVAIVSVSQAGPGGYYSLGPSVDVALSAVQSAPLVLAQINSQIPFVYHDQLLRPDQIHAAIEVDEALPDLTRPSLTEVDQAIGRHVAGLVEDGSCLQVGIGRIPDAVLAALEGHRYLGLHSEMWSDGALSLIERGVIDNSRKRIYPGRSVSSFLLGSPKLYQFVHNNPGVFQLSADYVNRPAVIANNPLAVSINSAVEVDLTGQICADSIGHRVISGSGGQVDFVRGTRLSPGGRSVIALPSQTKKGESRIVPRLRPGAGVVTTRSLVQHVATEFGVVNLHGMTLGERAKALIGIAHPAHREQLAKEWKSITQSFNVT